MDRRERHFQLTAAGRRELDRARPQWERAQQRLRSVLGDSGWERLQADLLRVTEAAERA
jgi:DNA-binding PadR family transcriptional regulator